MYLRIFWIMHLDQSVGQSFQTVLKSLQYQYFCECRNIVVPQNWCFDKPLETLYYLILRKKHRILYYYFDMRFYVNFLHVWWHKKDIFLLIFIAQSCKNVYCKHRKTSVFQDLIAIKFHFQMNYDIHRQVTNNSLGSHEYRQLREWRIIPSNLKLSVSDTIEILQS